MAWSAERRSRARLAVGTGLASLIAHGALILAHWQAGPARPPVSPPDATVVAHLIAEPAEVVVARTPSPRAGHPRARARAPFLAARPVAPAEPQPEPGSAVPDPPAATDHVPDTPPAKASPAQPAVPGASESLPEHAAPVVQAVDPQLEHRRWLDAGATLRYESRPWQHRAWLQARVRTLLSHAVADVLPADGGTCVVSFAAGEIVYECDASTLAEALRGAAGLPVFLGRLITLEATDGRLLIAFRPGQSPLLGPT